MATGPQSAFSSWRSALYLTDVRYLRRQILQAAVLYFLLVFGAGFVLGTGRVLFLVPLLGERAAELLEIPLMLGVIVFAARWIVRHSLDDRRLISTLSVGFIAMGLVLIADLTVGMLLRGMSAAEIFLHRDPVTGAAYYVSLLLFAVMPTIMARRRQT
jgi:hypothetical protein